MKNEKIMDGKDVLNEAYEAYKQRIANGEIVGGFALIAQDIAQREGIDPYTGGPLPRKAYKGVQHD